MLNESKILLFFIFIFIFIFSFYFYNLSFVYHIVVEEYVQVLSYK